MKLCEHGNYHCNICEVRMLNLVCKEQKGIIKQLHEENEKLKEKIKWLELANIELDRHPNT